MCITRLGKVLVKGLTNGEFDNGLNSEYQRCECRGFQCLPSGKVKKQISAGGCPFQICNFQVPMSKKGKSLAG